MTPDTKFMEAIREGNLERCKQLYSKYPRGIDINARNCQPMLWACEGGHLEIAKWLNTLGAHPRYSHLDFACLNGHLDTAKWIVSKKLDSTGKWTVEYRSYPETTGNPIDLVSRAFVSACQNNHVKLAEWLLSVGGMNAHHEEDQAFRLACERGRVEAALWLYYSVGEVDIHAKNNSAYRTANGLDYGYGLQDWLRSIGADK